MARSSSSEAAERAGWPGKDATPARRFARDLPSPIPPHPLEDLLTPERRHAFRQVLARRVTSLAVVVEDCYDPHNATAVIRTCEAFGIHRIHVTTGRSSYKINRRVSQGAHRYVDLHVHRVIDEAYQELRRDGYRILASDLRADAVAGPQRLQEELDGGGRLALVFGSEGFGLSDAASAQADGHFLIPMAGFTQSLNLSVSAASTIYAVRAAWLSADAPGDLDAEEQAYWYDHWIREQHPAAAAAAERAGGYTPARHPHAAQAIVSEGVDKRGEALDILQAPPADHDGSPPL